MDESFTRLQKLADMRQQQGVHHDRRVVQVDDLRKVLRTFVTLEVTIDSLRQELINVSKEHLAEICNWKAKVGEEKLACLEKRDQLRIARNRLQRMEIELTNAQAEIKHLSKLRNRLINAAAKAVDKMERVEAYKDIVMDPELSALKGVISYGQVYSRKTPDTEEFEEEEIGGVNNGIGFSKN